MHEINLIPFLIVKEKVKSGRDSHHSIFDGNEILIII